MKNIELKRDPSCSISLTITALRAIWTPDESERLDRIKIEEDPFEYDDDTGITSGGTATFENPYLIDDSEWHEVKEIRWDTNIGPSDFDFTFTLSDGSTKRFTLDL